MGTEVIPSRSHRWRIFAIAIALLIAVALVLYVSALIMQVYSARQASKMLDALEALRVGDPASSLERAVPGCKIEEMASDYRCEIFPGWGQWQWRLLSRVTFVSDLRKTELLRRAGIQPWYISVSSSVREGRIWGIRVLAIVVGRHKSLGAEWQIAESIPSSLLHEPNPGRMRSALGLAASVSLVYPVAVESTLLSHQVARRGSCRLGMSIVPVLVRLADVMSCVICFQTRFRF